jgi:hypothetical protein
MKKERNVLLGVNSTLQEKSLLLNLFACYLLIFQCYWIVEKTSNTLFLILIDIDQTNEGEIMMNFYALKFSSEN